MPLSPAHLWWMENTAQGRRTARRILPESALGPRARREAREEREEREREETLRRMSLMEISAEYAMLVHRRDHAEAERVRQIGLRNYPRAPGLQRRRAR